MITKTTGGALSEALGKVLENGCSMFSSITCLQAGVSNERINHSGTLSFRPLPEAGHMNLSASVLVQVIIC
jgi:hypothetical protein